MFKTAAPIFLIAFLFAMPRDAIAYKKDGKCYNKINLAILLDSSGSIAKENWHGEIEFAKQIVQANNVPNSGNKFAILDFSKAASIISNFEQDTAKVTNALDTLKANYKDGHSYIDAGLSKAAEIFPNNSSGEAAQNILITITDGYMTFRDGKGNEEFLKIPKDKLVAAKVLMFAIGVGASVKDKTLQFIASEPSSSRVFKISDPVTLISEILKATETNCTESATSIKCTNLVLNRVGDGCYKDNKSAIRPLPDLILTDRDPSDPNYSYKTIDWSNWRAYLPDFICRCAEKANSLKRIIFGVQNYGECWSSTRLDTYNMDGPPVSKAHCLNKEYKECNTTDLYCIGIDKHNFVYKIDGST